MSSAELPSSLPSSLSSPRLPVELLGQVVDEAAGDRDELDYTTLRHLCLASKSILPFARSALYRDITVTFRDNRQGRYSPDIEWTHTEYESEMDETPGVAWERGHTTTDGDELETTLSHAPHLATFVGGITLRYFNTNLVTCLWRLRMVDADVLEVEPIADALLHGLRPLVQLDLNLVDTLPPLVARLSKLRHLRLGSVTSPAETSPFPSTLTHLRLDNWNEHCHSALPSALQTLAPSLMTLDLRGSAISNLGAHLADFKAVVHLTVRAIAGETHSSLATIYDSISLLDSLKSLHITGWSFVSPHLDRIPPHLQSLHARMMLGQQRLESFLASDSRGAFRQVIVDKIVRDTAWRNEEMDWEELGERHGWLVERFGKEVHLLR